MAIRRRDTSWALTRTTDLYLWRYAGVVGYTHNRFVFVEIRRGGRLGATEAPSLPDAVKLSFIRNPVTETRNPKPESLTGYSPHSDVAPSMTGGGQSDKRRTDCDWRGTDTQTETHSLSHTHTHGGCFACILKMQLDLINSPRYCVCLCLSVFSVCVCVCVYVRRMGPCSSSVI